MLGPVVTKLEADLLPKREMRYYRVLADNQQYPDRWFLGEPLTANGKEIDAREFCYARVYTGPAPAVLPVTHQGPRVAFLLAAFDMPVVSTEVADILQSIAPADIQRFPVMVDPDIAGYEIIDCKRARRPGYLPDMELNIAGYEIVNAVHQLKCVDEARSVFRKWGPQDHRSDKIGQYREIAKLVIDPARTEGRQIFRLWGSLVELIVSETVKQALEGVPNLGIVFAPVTE